MAGKYRAVSTAEKRAQLEAGGEEWPTCDCHGEPFVWHKDKRRIAGGFMSCRLDHARAAATYRASPDARRRARAYSMLHGAEQKRRFRDRSRELGRCQDCTEIAVDGTSRCVKHRERDLAGKRLRARYGLPAPLVRELGLNTDRRTSANH